MHPQDSTVFKVERIVCIHKPYSSVWANGWHQQISFSRLARHATEFLIVFLCNKKFRSNCQPFCQGSNFCPAIKRNSFLFQFFNKNPFAGTYLCYILQATGLPAFGVSFAIPKHLHKTGFDQQVQFVQLRPALGD